jgi:hypothetical protein
MSRANMIRRWGDKTVTLGTANTYTGRSTVQKRLEEYLSYIDNDQPGGRRGDESWYLFGDNSEAFWADVLEPYVPPRFSDPSIPSPPRPDALAMRTLAFGIGGRGSGVPFHTHGPGWSEVLHGAKQWFLVPPPGSTTTDEGGEQTRREGSRTASTFRPPQFFDPNASTLQWTRSTNYTRFGQRGEITEGLNLLECVIRPGDALFFPSQWFHATLNLEPYTAFVSAFT